PATNMEPSALSGASVLSRTAGTCSNEEVSEASSFACSPVWSTSEANGLVSAFSSCAPKAVLVAFGMLCPPRILATALRQRVATPPSQRGAPGCILTNDRRMKCFAQVPPNKTVRRVGSAVCGCMAFVARHPPFHARTDLRLTPAAPGRGHVSPRGTWEQGGSRDAGRRTCGLRAGNRG